MKRLEQRSEEPLTCVASPNLSCHVKRALARRALTRSRHWRARCCFDLTELQGLAHHQQRAQIRTLHYQKTENGEETSR